MQTWLILLLAVVLLLIVYALVAAWRISLRFFNQTVWRKNLRKGLPFEPKSDPKLWEAYNNHIHDCVVRSKSLPYEKHILTTPDGVELFGRLFVPPRAQEQTGPAKVLLGCHGLNSRGDVEFSQTLPFWQERGFYVLAPDLRAHGRSGGEVVGYGITDSDDMLLWLDWLRDRLGDDCRVLLMGSSMGGGCVMMTADRPEILPNVRGIISDCGFDNIYNANKDLMWRVHHLPRYPILPFFNLHFKRRLGYSATGKSSHRSVKNSPLPVLLLYATKDSFVSYRRAQRMAAIDPDRITLVSFEGVEHVMNHFIDPVRYEAALDDLIARTGMTADKSPALS